MKMTKSKIHDTLVQLVREKSDKRHWTESLLSIVRTAKNSRGENRMRELARLESEIIGALANNSDDRQIKRQILEVNHDFVEQLKQLHPGLTGNEILLSCFFLMDVPAATIASLKGISMASLHVARSRLKNKLGIAEGQNLDEYLLQMQVD